MNKKKCMILIQEEQCRKIKWKSTSLPQIRIAEDVQGYMGDLDRTFDHNGP